MTASPMRSASFVSLKVDVSQEGLPHLEGIEAASEGSSSGDAVVYSLSSGEGEPQEVVKEVKLDVLDTMGLTGCGGMAAVFYGVAFTYKESGVWTPLVLVMGFAVVWLLKIFLLDLLTALPVNGGSYNALSVLNGTSAAIFVAAVHYTAYVAIGATSAKYAVLLIKSFFDYPAWVSPIPFTITVIAMSSIASCLGTQVGGRTSFYAMNFHVLCMVVFIAACVATSVQGYDAPTTENNTTFDGTIFHYNIEHGGGVGFTGIFYGFATSLVLVAGVHEPAEQPEHLVFAFNAKRIVNTMYVVVACGAVTVSVLSIFLVKYSEADECFKEGTLMVLMARRTGRWVEKLVCFDGIVMLSVGVISGFSSFTSLASRMATDGKMPAILNTPNSLGAKPFCTILYAVATSTVYIILDLYDGRGDTVSLQLMAVTALILGYTFSEITLKRLSQDLQLPRPNNPPSWVSVHIVLVAGICGLVGASLRITTTEVILLSSVLVSCVVLALYALYSTGKLTSCVQPLRWSFSPREEEAEIDPMAAARLRQRRDTILTWKPTSNSDCGISTASTSRAPTPRWTPPPSPVIETV